MSLLPRMLRTRVAVSSLMQRRMFIVPSMVRYDSFGSHMNDNNPKIIDQELQRKNNEKRVDTYHHMAPGWSEVMASESEAQVKADRSPPKSFEKMQDESIDKLYMDELMDEGPAVLEESGGRWREAHATESEASVKAERDEAPRRPPGHLL
ncbi:hypothetical protein BDF22DRAFT_744267 [Syncephalis plumigaleata]|nr:hypothetical protein BDF22DRAFT_744267 [Syncephalis plumigaleata]